jgi:hypothetical protein
MKQLYIEQRKLHSPAATLAADIARHLESRQYLGAALIVCDNPGAILSAVRKQWLKAARRLLKLRASTLNAEEILRLTHVIMHMQTMHFVAKSPLDSPDATIFFASPDQMLPLPEGCYTTYIVVEPPAPAMQAMATKLPADALVVSYIGDIGLSAAPREGLQQYVYDEWEKLASFLERHEIAPSKLVVGNSLQFSVMDDALDTLLGVADGFLRHAASFQHAINLAQPLSGIPSEQQKMFEAVTRLAHRVQALTPGNFSHYLVHTFDDSGHDPFFLRDTGSELYKDLEAAAHAKSPTQTPH